ncbi:hypothetical protein Tco_1108404 [Tanacetum coccineum]
MVAYLKKTEGSEGFHQIVDFLNASHIRYALAKNLTIYVSLIQQFWQTATANTLDNGEMEITATIDGKVKIVTEASIRRHLKLEDSYGISNLPTTKILKKHALMGYVSNSDKFQKGHFSPQWRFCFPLPSFFFCLFFLLGEGSTVLVESHHTPTGAPSTSKPPISSPSRRTTRQETKVPQPSSPPHTNVADEVASTGVDVRHGGAATTVTSLDAGQGSGNIDKTLTMPHDSPLPRGHTLRSDEGRMKHNELMDLDTKLSNRVVALDTYLKKTNKVYGANFTKLIKKVKKLEKTVKSNQARRAKIVVSDDEEDLKDSSKQERMIEEINQDARVTLLKKMSTLILEEEAQLVIVVVVNTTGASMPVVIKDKGKAKMDESEPEQTKTKLQQRQERAGYEAAVRLQEQLDEEERKRIARVHEEASSFNIEEWEDIQATIEADEELAQRIQAEEREKYSEAEKARLLAELINQRKRYFTQQRAEERRNKPLTQAQQRTYMSNYIKHMGSHTLQQLKRLSFDELKNLFEATMRRVGAFVPMETEIRREVHELAAGSSKRDAEEELDQRSSKRQKTSENSEPTEESKEKENDELSQEELQQLMIIVPEEGMNVEALQTKYPIIDWEVYTEDSRMY